MIDHGNFEETSRHGQSVHAEDRLRGTGLHVGRGTILLETWECLDKVTSIFSMKTEYARRPGRTKPPRAPLAARTSRVARFCADKLLARIFHLTQTSLPTYPFTSVRERRLVLPIHLLVSSARLSAYPFTSVRGRRFVLLICLLVPPARLPAYPFTSVASFHSVYGRNRITWQTKAQQKTTGYDSEDFRSNYHCVLLG